jgi:SRSO17 transposase
MAARLAPENVRRTHQSLHHLVSAAPWRDEAVLESVRGQVLTAMKQSGPVAAWIVDDTGLPKKGTHSVGVARQYCGQLGKQDNCQVAVSLSVATHHVSLPVAWRLYLPESWASDRKRCKAAGVPDQITFQTKPVIALGQIREAVEQGVPTAPILADAGYGQETRFRQGITELGLSYVVGIQENTTVWRPGEIPQRKKRRKGKGRPPTRLQRDRIISRFPSSNWRWSCRNGHGKRSLGARVPARHCARALRRFAFAPHTVTICVPNHTLKNGC